MCLKIVTFAVVVALNLVVFCRVEVQGCKLYCVVCRSDVQFNQITKYYCCMEDWEDEPKVKNCGEESTTISTTTSSTTLVTTPTTTITTPTTPVTTPTPTTTVTTPTTPVTTPTPTTTVTTPTTSTTAASTPTPCPTFYPPTPSPYRCPEVGTPSPETCKATRRIHPNPSYCSVDSDCDRPFNVCCEDGCFGGKICKTYREVIEDFSDEVQ